IRTLTDAFEGRVLVGAGTVMSTEQVELAYKAGAKYIISPDSCREVIEGTVELGMVSIPGVFTPTEAANAHRWGADFVKLFPNSEVNISYLKCLTVPLSHIRFLAVGGVNADNLADYLSAGAVGVGVATSIVNKKLIAEEKYDEITKLALAHTKAAGIEL
ncbi:MAG: 2-dehydro-3-deoxyphosphogluconate aldolase, partial [Clostridia bacterium]|nr:2-dehydro-3-deoxyphosphogluconate aldolase [Clostridia bacterium]